MTRFVTPRLILTITICLGALLTLLGSVQDDPALEALTEDPATSLTADERAYTRFIVPRLDRLIEEGEAVSRLVADRSRNLIALNAHANRIGSLSSDIAEWRAGSPVPPRFQDAHVTLISSGVTMNDVIDEAGSMLVTLDFGGVRELIPRFDSAVDDLRQVRETWPVAGQSPISGTLSVRGSDGTGAAALQGFLGMTGRPAP